LFVGAGEDALEFDVHVVVGNYTHVSGGDVVSEESDCFFIRF